MTIPDEVDIIVVGGGSCGSAALREYAMTQVTDEQQVCASWPSGQLGPQPPGEHEQLV